MVAVEGGGRNPCHYRFSLTREFPTGGSIHASFLQANLLEEIPKGATEIAPLEEGDTLFESLGGRGRHVHSHQGEVRYSKLGIPHVQVITVRDS